MTVSVAIIKCANESFIKDFALPTLREKFFRGKKINEIQILAFFSDTVSFQLGLLETIGYFVICISKQVLRIQGPRGDL